MLRSALQSPPYASSTPTLPAPYSSPSDPSAALENCHLKYWGARNFSAQPGAGRESRWCRGAWWVTGGASGEYKCCGSANSGENKHEFRSAKPVQTPCSKLMVKYILFCTGPHYKLSCASLLTPAVFPSLSPPRSGIFSDATDLKNTLVLLFRDHLTTNTNSQCCQYFESAVNIFFL